MAKPRVFLSSTFYDLRYVRADLEKFIRELGYEPVLNERGSIPYAKDERLETSCYREVQTVDMLVCIVGGRFGAQSNQAPYSITQRELREALDAKKQVYVFVERSVLGEYRTFLVNKDVKGIRYQFADDPRVYSFLEEIYSLPTNNIITPFDTSDEITAFLREQWAALFQRLLEARARVEDAQLTIKLSETAKTLDQLVDFLAQEKVKGGETLRGILLPSHPAFKQLAELTGTEYRIYFTNEDELGKWFRARGFAEVDGLPNDTATTWTRRYRNTTHRVTIDDCLFDEDGNIVVYSNSEWHKEWITFETIPDPEPPNLDDTPF